MSRRDSDAASRAQALLLGSIEGHARQDEPVYVFDERGNSIVSFVALADDHGPLHGVDLFVSVDESLAALIPAALPGARRATLHACSRRGWITDVGVDEFETQRLGVCWFVAPRVVRLRRLALSEAGRDALHAYRLKPAEDVPALGGIEREIVELAARAERFGYALVPVTDDAKRGARALARTPFAKRGWGGGASTRSLQATATGEVEVCA